MLACGGLVPGFFVADLQQSPLPSDSMLGMLAWLARHGKQEGRDLDCRAVNAVHV